MTRPRPPGCSDVLRFGLLRRRLGGVVVRSGLVDGGLVAAADDGVVGAAALVLVPCSPLAVAPLAVPSLAVHAGKRKGKRRANDDDAQLRSYGHKLGAFDGQSLQARARPVRVPANWRMLKAPSALVPR